MMQRFADEPMRIEFTPQSAQFVALPRTQQCIRDALSAAKASHNSAYRGDFHLRSRIAYQKNAAVSHAALYWNPFAIDRNASPLPLQRFQAFLFQKALDALFCFLPATLSNDAQRSTRFVFRNQPVKIRRVVRDEPHPRGIRAAIFREANNRLNQWDGFDRRPSGGTADPAGRPIRANHRVRVYFLPLAPGFNFQTETAGIRCESKKMRIKRKS